MQGLFWTRISYQIVSENLVYSQEQRSSMNQHPNYAPSCSKYLEALTSRCPVFQSILHILALNCAEGFKYIHPKVISTSDRKHFNLGSQLLEVSPFRNSVRLVGLYFWK